jgi:tyrosyl-DNA phosphodiesterase 1
MNMSPPDRKRQRTDDYSLTTTDSVAAEVRSRRSAFLASLNRGISPPAGREPPSQKKTEPEAVLQLESETDTSNLPSMFPLRQELRRKTPDFPKHHVIQSPFKLTRIRALPASANVDTIGIRDILGDVMLKEVWLFDFLYDVDWVM